MYIKLYLRIYIPKYMFASLRRPTIRYCLLINQGQVQGAERGGGAEQIISLTSTAQRRYCVNACTNRVGASLLSRSILLLLYHLGEYRMYILLCTQQGLHL